MENYTIKNYNVEYDFSVNISMIVLYKKFNFDKDKNKLTKSIKDFIQRYLVNSGFEEDNISINIEPYLKININTNERSLVFKNYLVEISDKENTNKELFYTCKKEEKIITEINNVDYMKYDILLKLLKILNTKFIWRKDNEKEECFAI